MSGEASVSSYSPYPPKKPVEMEAMGHEALLPEEVYHQLENTDSISQAMNIVDENVNGGFITENSKKIASSLDQYSQEITSWNQVIDKFMTQLQQENTDRKDLISKFSEEIKKSYRSEIAEIDEAGVSEKIIRLETNAMKYTNLGQKIASTLEFLDKDKQLRWDSQAIEDLEEGLQPLLLTIPWLNVGMLGYKIHVHAELRASLENELELSLQQMKLHDLTPEEHLEMERKCDLLQSEIDRINHQQQELAEKIAESTVRAGISSIKLGSKALSSDVVQQFIVSGSEFFKNLSTLSSVSGFVGGEIAFAFNVKSCVENSNQLKMLELNRSLLEEEHKNCKDTLQAVILKAKIDRVKVMERELSLSLGKSIVRTTTSTLAIASSVKGILLASGVAVGTAATTALTVSGIGAILIGAGVTVMGGAYAGYKHRHELEFGAKYIESKSRMLVNELMLKREMDTYKKGKTLFDELTNQLEEVGVFLDTAWETKERLDQTRGSQAIEQQKMITRVVVDLSSQLSQLTETASEASNVMATTLPKIRELQSTIKLLQKRIDRDERKMESGKLLDRFSQYDIHSLIIVQNHVEEALSTIEGRESLRDFMQSHSFKPTDPITWSNVLDFIMESKEISNREIMVA